MQEKLKIKIKKLNPNSVIPNYAKQGDAAMDVYATSETIVDTPGYGYIEYGTGLAFEIPEGYYMDIRPRSSVSNTGLILSNSAGILDSGYRGELKLRFKWVKESAKYNVGDRIGQIMIKPYPVIEWVEVQELNNTERGEGGFGSTNE
jgi:dUTP pyrophosphatase